MHNRYQFTLHFTMPKGRDAIQQFQNIVRYMPSTSTATLENFSTGTMKILGFADTLDEAKGTIDTCYKYGATDVRIEVVDEAAGLAMVAG